MVQKTNCDVQIGKPPLNKYIGPSSNGILSRAFIGEVYPLLSSVGHVLSAKYALLAFSNGIEVQHVGKNATIAHVKCLNEFESAKSWGDQVPP